MFEENDAKLKTKTEKIQQWIKAHKKLSALITAGVVVVLAAITVLIIMLLSAGSQTEEAAPDTKTTVSGGDFYYVDCEADEDVALTVIEAAEAEACAAAANSPGIWTYLEAAEEAAEDLDDADKASLYLQLADTALEYMNNVKEQSGEISQELKDKVVELAKQADEISQSASSASAVAYYAEEVGDDATQEEYNNLIKERIGGDGTSEEGVSGAIDG